MNNLPTNYNLLQPKMKRLVREKYVELQQGLCCHCKSSLQHPSPLVGQYNINVRLFPQGFFDHPVHLHHSHVTGMTIGAVHNVCNAILWQYYGE